MSWERIIDEEIINENQKYTTVINQQHFDYNEVLVHTIDEILQKSKPVVTASSIVAGGDETEQGLTSITPTPDPQCVVMPDQLSVEDQKQHKFLMQINYLFAGYLPPGKNTVYIYDRHNKILLGREIHLDFSNGYAGDENTSHLLETNRTVAGPTFTFKPPTPLLETEPEE